MQNLVFFFKKSIIVFSKQDFNLNKEDLEIKVKNLFKELKKKKILSIPYKSITEKIKVLG